MIPFVVDSLKSIVAIVGVFVVCIVIHEFGHYIVAKKSGVAVPAFAIGFGPKIFKWTRGQTEYSIRLFPIGGLVQLAGEVPQDTLFQRGEQVGVRFDAQGRVSVIGDPEHVPGGVTGILRDFDLMNRLQVTLEIEGLAETYQVRPHAALMTNSRSSIPLVEKHEQVLGKPLWKRAAMILAGPVMNFLLAGVIFSAVYVHMGYPSNTSTLGAIVPNSPASVSGLHEGDRVISVNGQPVNNWSQLVNSIRNDYPPKTLHVEVVRDGRTQEVDVTPKLVGRTPQLGVNASLEHGVVGAIGQGFYYVYYGSVNALQLYGQVLKYHEFNYLSGPVGISQVISQQAQTGFWNVLMIAGLLSLNLGLFNLLPIPALDGGRLLFMLVELIRGKSIDPRKEGLVHFVGFALLMLFAVVITYRDVSRLF